MKVPDKAKSPSLASKLPPLSIVKMLWNRRWLALTVWVLITAAAVFTARQLRPMYKADVLVLVDAQKIPDRFVASTVDQDLADSLALISQEIMSRTRLTRIIDMFGLYKQERKTKTQEEIIQQMRNDISLKVERGSGGSRMGAFRLGYQGSNPVIVAEVTNELAKLYVTENLRSRENQAEGTVQFLELQLNRAKKSLDEQESKVTEFKQRYNGVLPQQENSLLASLGNLRIQLEGTQDSLNRAQAEKDVAETALASAKLSEAALLRSLQPKFRSAETAARGGMIAPSRSEVLERRLQDLLQRYTPQHPEVQALQTQIAEARREEDKAAAAMAKFAKSAKSSDPTNQTQITALTPELLNERERIAVLNTQLANIQRNMALQTKAREQALAQIASLEERVSRLPLVEQQMAALTRNYEISKENYKSLLDKELAAGIATQLEKSQKSERFTVMDPARVPEKPFKPKKLVIEAAGSLAGLALGTLLGLGLEWRKKQLLGEWELPADIAILGRVPLMEMASKKIAFHRASTSHLIFSLILLVHGAVAGWVLIKG